jgi:hypothetical protein
MTSKVLHVDLAKIFVCAIVRMSAMNELGGFAISGDMMFCWSERHEKAEITPDEFAPGTCN